MAVLPYSAVLDALEQPASPPVIRGWLWGGGGPPEPTVPDPEPAECKGLLIVTLPTEEKPEYASFPGVMTLAVSAAVAYRAADLTPKVLAFTSTAAAQRSYLLEGTSDAETAFALFWQPGLRPMPKLQTHRMEGVEPFLRRASTYGMIQVAPVTSNVLDTDGGTVGGMVDVDLTQVKVFSLTSLDARGRFLGFRFSGLSSANPVYQGAAIYGRRV